MNKNTLDIHQDVLDKGRKNLLEKLLPYTKDFVLGGLKIFSVKDIAIQKAYTIGRRGEYRDYFDLYIILRNNYISLKEIISEAKKIYGGVFAEKIFLQQLVYFEDLLNFDITPMTKPQLKPKEVKHFFEEQVSEYLSNLNTEPVLGKQK